MPEPGNDRQKAPLWVALGKGWLYALLPFLAGFMRLMKGAEWWEVAALWALALATLVLAAFLRRAHERRGL